MNLTQHLMQQKWDDSLEFPIGAILSVVSDRFERKFVVQAGMTVWTLCFLGIAVAAIPAPIYARVFLLAGLLGF